MKKLLTLLQRFINSFCHAVVFGTFLGVVTFYAFTLFLFKEPGFAMFFGMLLGYNAVAVAFCCLVAVFGKKRPLHKYDDELVGDNFTGFGKKIRIFHQAQESFLYARYNKALAGFQRLEDEFADKTTDEEKALVCFYTARCYQIMNYAPNAVKYFESAEQSRRAPKINSFFYARALGENGDTCEAAELFRKILADETNPYRIFVRCEAGRMYLQLNDGKTALEWFGEAMKNHEDYANALGGAAVAHTILHNFKDGEELYRQALLNHIDDPDGFTDYYKRVQAAALVETHTPEALNVFTGESDEKAKEEN